jgi:MFS family permease
VHDVSVQHVGEGVLGGGRRTLTIGLVATITLVAFEGLAVATVLPDVSKDLGGLSLYGWAFSAFFLGSLVGIVGAGRAADRRGPAMPFVAGLVLFGAGLLGAGAAPTMLALVLARAVQGVGAGVIPAVAYVAIGRGYPTELQPRMFAVISSAWVVPGVVGPALAGAVSDTFGWRWVFLGLLPLVVASGALTVPGLHALGAPEATDEDPVDRRADAVVLAIGAGLVLGGLSARSLLPAVGLIAVGALVGVHAFLRLMPPGTARLQRGMPAAIGLRGILMFAFFGTDAYVSLTLTSLHGASTTLAGVALTAAAITWASAAWVQARRASYVSPRTFVRTGALVIAAGIVGMIVIAHFGVPIAIAVLAWGVAGFGMGLAYAPLALIVLAEAEPGREGTASASLQLSETLGVALGTGVSGAIVAAGAAFGWTRSAALVGAFVVSLVVAFIASGAAQRLPNRFIASVAG